MSTAFKVVCAKVLTLVTQTCSRTCGQGLYVATIKFLLYSVINNELL